MKKNKAKRVAKVRKQRTNAGRCCCGGLVGRLLKAVPSNWCDPILSGPNSALPSASAGKWGCPDIERLLNAIRERLRQTANTKAQT